MFSKISILCNIKRILSIALFGVALFGLNACKNAQAEDIIKKNIIGTNQEQFPLVLYGKLEQGGIVIGKTLPNAKINAGGIETNSNEQGDFVFGFDRDAEETMTLTIVSQNKKQSISRVLKIKKREYNITEVNGLPPATVNPPPEAMEKIQRDSAMKQAGFASIDTQTRGFLSTFSWPLEKVRVTSNWGAQRSLNGNLQRPHYGVDLGAAKGVPIFAPADGKVIIAQEGMHFEGGMIAIDHGQGLISNYLHQSKIIVHVGDYVIKGQKIGLVGAEGRATGPHLCWRMRWRGRQLDPVNLVTPLPQIIFDNKIGNAGN